MQIANKLAGVRLTQTWENWKRAEDRYRNGPWANAAAYLVVAPARLPNPIVGRIRMAWTGRTVNAMLEDWSANHNPDPMAMRYWGRAGASGAAQTIETAALAGATLCGVTIDYTTDWRQQLEARGLIVQSAL
jgi:hypothetical protein